MNDIKIIKVVNKSKTYQDKNGKSHPQVNYYIVVNNSWIAFRPSFSKGYTQLDLVCETRVNGGTDEHKE